MIEINNNIPKEQVENILNQVRELNTQIGYAVNIYPFRPVSGITHFTETGEKDLNWKSSDFRNCIDLITSSDPMIYYWDDSYHSQVYFPGDEWAVKKFNVGAKIECYISNYTKNVELNNISLGAPGKENAYTYIQMTRNISMFTCQWTPTDDEMRHYLFVVVDKKANSPQFLRAVDSTPLYTPSGKYLGSNVTFTNVNLAFSQSGKDILNFPKVAAPGGNYAFPKEVETENGIITILDNDIINNVGVNDIQLYFEGAYSLNSIYVLGRPADVKKLYPTRRLLLVNPHPPISSALDVTGVCANEYYACFSAKPIFYGLWDNWKQKLEALYNNTAKKTFLGGVSINYAETEQTNGITDDTQDYNLWNNWRFKPTTNHTYDTRDVWACDESITFNNTDTMSVCDFLNHNSTIYSCYEQLPTEYTEFTKFTLTDFGFFGKIAQWCINFVTANLLPPVGWLTSSTPVPRKNINLLIPISVYNIAKTICADTTLQPIPYDVFTNSQDFTGGGNENVNCGFRAELTDLFYSPSQKNYREDATIGTGKDGYWNTLYLGQTKFKNDVTFKEASNDEFEMLIWKSDCKAIRNNTQSASGGYEIDFVQYQGIGKANCRLNFHKYIGGNFTTATSTYEARQKTNALFKDDIKLWRNQLKLNFSEEMNHRGGTLSYPEALLPNADVYGNAYSLFQTDQEFNFNTALEKYLDSVPGNDTSQRALICVLSNKSITFNLFEVTGMSTEEILLTYPNSTIDFDFISEADAEISPTRYNNLIKHYSILLSDLVNNNWEVQIPTSEIASTDGFPNCKVLGANGIIQNYYIMNKIPVGSYTFFDSDNVYHVPTRSTTPILLTAKYSGVDNFNIHVDDWENALYIPTATLYGCSGTWIMEETGALQSKGDITFSWHDIPDDCINNICYLIIPPTDAYYNTIAITNAESTQTQEMFNWGGVVSFYTDKADDEEQVISAGAIHTGTGTIWSTDRIAIIERTYEGRRQFAIKVYTRFNTPNVAEPKANRATSEMQFLVSSRPYCIYENNKYTPNWQYNVVSHRYYATFGEVENTPRTQATPKMRYKISNAVIFLKGIGE